jgi:hypothetical protein
VVEHHDVRAGRDPFTALDAHAQERADDESQDDAHERVFDDVPRA